MEVTRESLGEKFKLYNDARTAGALSVGRIDGARQARSPQAELASRGIDTGCTHAGGAGGRSADARPDEPDEPVIEGDLVEVARLLDPVEAEMRARSPGGRRRPGDGCGYATRRTCCLRS